MARSCDPAPCFSHLQGDTWCWDAPATDAPAPVADSVSGGLDSANGFGGASAPGRGSRAWVVQEPTTLGSVDADRDALRPVWVLGSLLALVTGIVLAAPERRRRR